MLFPDRELPHSRLHRTSDLLFDRHFVSTLWLAKSVSYPDGPPVVAADQHTKGRGADVEIVIVVKTGDATVGTKEPH